MAEASTKNSGAQAEALKFLSGAVDSPFQCLKDEKDEEKQMKNMKNKGIPLEYSYSEYH